MNDCDSDLKDRFVATLLGCAIGDTLGMPVEGWKPSQIRRHVGRVTAPIPPAIVRDAEGTVLTSDEDGKLKGYSRDLSIGAYTDDTILTLAIAESIAKRRRLDLVDVARQHLLEYEKRCRPDGTVIGGFGSTTIAGIKHLQEGMPPTESGVIGGPGNAPAMKMHPVGMYIAATGRYGDGMQFAEKVGRITHLDPRSLISGVMQTHAIYRMLAGTTRDAFIDDLVYYSMKQKRTSSAFARHEKGGMYERMEWIRQNKDATADDAHKTLGSSSLVMSSYPFALFMVQRHWDTPLEGLIETVNYGGDCDTTGAIYGALAGARHGIFFPKEWLDVLQDVSRLQKAAEGIYALRR